MISFNAESFGKSFEDLKHDLTVLSEIVHDPTFIEELRILLANNFERVWSSGGANINQDWNGRTLVKTGTLKLSLTTPGSLAIRIIGDNVIIGSTVSYDRWVNDRYVFYGVDNTFDSELTNLVENYLSRKGKLKWQ